MEYIKECLNQVWPMMLVVSIIAITLKLIYCIEQHEKINLNDILSFCFINYIIALFYLVSFQDVSWSTYNIEPFKEIFRYKFGSQLFIKNIIGNVLLFIPFGFLTASVSKIDKLYLSIIMGFVSSFTIEITQLLIGRVFDIDDIFLNMIGTIIGFLLYKVLRGIYEQNRNLQSNKKNNKRIRNN